MSTTRIRRQQWEVWGEWPGIPWFHSCFNAGLALELKKRCGLQLLKFASDYKDGVLKIYLPVGEWGILGKKYFDVILSRPRIFEQHLLAVERAADQLYSLNKQLSTLRPRVLSDQKLIQWYVRFHKAQHELWSAGMVPNLLELNQTLLSDHIRARIEKEKGGKLNQAQWQDLITPIKLSYAQQEELDLLHIVEAIGRQRDLKRRLISSRTVVSAEDVMQTSPALWRKLLAHHKRYCWVQYGWLGPATSHATYVDQVVRLVRMGDTHVRLREFQADDRRRTATKKKFRDQNPRDVNVLLPLLSRLLFNKTYRVDALYQGYYAIEPILLEMARRLHISKNQIYMIYGADMPFIWRTRKADISKINNAISYSAYILERGQLRFYLGAYAERKMQPIISGLIRIKITNTLEGTCGFPGKVKGIVKIVTGPKDMINFKENMVLVSHATDPSMIPVMKKAIGFVTNMGGLTCHAAIVARELKKPCVIGTKFATKILKDGDRVEVDAIRGIVRKLP